MRFLFLIIALIIYIIVISSLSSAQTLTRDSRYTTLKQPNGFSMRFDAWFGGAPLSWYQNGVLASNPFPGEGVQIVYDTGQDGTQSTATALDYYPIAQIGKPETYALSYFGLEEVAGMVNGQAVYQTSSFLPYFWVSLEYIDDAIPFDPRGDHRWSTYYHDILKLGYAGYHTFGTPIFYVGSPTMSGSLLLIGDEIKPTYNPNTPWYERVNRIPEGRFALRTTVHMGGASADSVATFLLRKSPYLNPYTDIYAVFFAPGHHLNINRYGLVQMVSNGVVIWTDASQYWPGNKLKLESVPGLEVEIRTHNWATEQMEIYLAGRLAGIVAAPGKGEVFGLMGSGTSGYIRFANRQFLDVGTRCTSRWETTARGTIKGTMSVYRVADPIVTPIYRINLPVAFTAENVREATYVWNQDWIKHTASQMSALFPNGIVPLVSPAWVTRAAWSGKSDGSLGIFIMPMSQSTKGHMLVAPSVQAWASVPYEANFNPVPFTSEKFVVEVAPKIRTDLLHD